MPRCFPVLTNTGVYIPESAARRLASGAFLEPPAGGRESERGGETTAHSGRPLSEWGKNPPLGVLLGSLGALLDPLGPLSGSLGGHFTLPRRRFGALLSTFLQKYAFLKTYGKHKEDLGFSRSQLSWGSLGALLGLSRRALGALLGLPSRHFGIFPPTFKQKCAFLKHMKHTRKIRGFSRSWAPLGLSWPSLGGLFGSLGASWRYLWLTGSFEDLTFTHFCIFVDKSMPFLNYMKHPRFLKGF